MCYDYYSRRFWEEREAERSKKDRDKAPAQAPEQTSAPEAEPTEVILEEPARVH